MTKVAVYNQSGEKQSELQVNEAVFGVASNSSLIHQVYVAMRANARQPFAHTKMRGDVRGGGKKPWKQKGTGRARHGSIRSPLWRGGGITFGPLSERNYAQKINKKMKAGAVKSCLSDKVQNDRLIVVEAYDFKGKSQTASKFRSVLPGSGRTTVLLVSEFTPELTNATRNVHNLDVVRAQDVSVIDLMHHQYVIASKDAVSVLEKRFVK
ncbi:MAG: 50S ribosomal protein L4 [Candidatus Magasanikbacteria bacterium]|nr:50S ribosomal protein L4 [Candidatus Magasanikbacteria bacterium]